MENLEKMGVPKRIVAFVLPTGYSFNLDGSTLYLAVASVFVAQVAGIELTLGTQLLMTLTLMLTSKGVAAVPRASLVILSGTLTSFGLPLEGVAVILGVDAIMDMARTSVNLLGNCLASVVMGAGKGSSSPPRAEEHHARHQRPADDDTRLRGALRLGRAAITACSRRPRPRPFSPPMCSNPPDDDQRLADHPGRRGRRRTRSGG